MTADRLIVWLGDDVIGTLSREGRRFGMRFRRDPGARGVLTVAADGSGDEWPPSFTRAWFDGLLPEEGRRGAAEVDHGVERGDSFGLLAAIGWECAGAVSVLPPGRAPMSGSYRQLTDEEVWARLDALPRHVDGVDRDVRMSLGGAQEKLLLARLDGAWQLPLDGATSTHILKSEPARFPGLAVAEAWALATASSATVTATADVLTPQGHRPSVVVQRYDRRASDRGLVRIHQEDGCQVLGLPPEQKYPRSAGPRVASLARIAALLVARAREPTDELGRLLEQTVVNIGLLNTDAHAKNLSVLHTGRGTISLSPLYDVAPTAWFLPDQAQAALPIGGKWQIHEIERRHLLDEARSWGMPERHADAIVVGTLERLLAGLQVADSRYPSTQAPMRAAVGSQVHRLLSGR